MAFNAKVISHTTANVPGTEAAATVVDDLINVEQARIIAALTGPTGGTLDCYIQSFDPTDSTWYDVVHFPQISAGAAVAYYVANLSRIATAPNVTVLVGKDLSPALGANAVVRGEFGITLRAVFVSGAGTTLGAAQRLAFHWIK
jgi:hypothetical protein